MQKKLKDILAPMTTKEKINYIWHYYRVHIIIGIVILIVLITTVNGILNKKDPAINMMVLGEKVDYNMTETVRGQMNKEFLTDEQQKDYEIVLQPIIYSEDGMDGSGPVGLQKMVAEIAGGFLNILVANQAMYEQMNVENQLKDINSVVDLSSYDFDPEENFYYEGDKVTGIKASAIAILDKIIYDEDAILYLPGNAKEQEFTSDFLDYLFTVQQ